MERLAMEQLKKWKDSPNRQPLLVYGVRQSGKTWLLKQFGTEEFENMAYFDFEQNPSLGSFFNENLDPNLLIQNLSVMNNNKPIEPGKTLLILDEIQKCPRALTSLKYFDQDLPELHVIAAGSLLGVALKRKDESSAAPEEPSSYPVGKVDHLNLRPMNFLEFLIADGKKALVDLIRPMPLDQPVPEAFHNILQTEYQLYQITGGMPEAVQTWIDTHSFEYVEAVQDKLLRDAQADFPKYASSSDIPKIGWIWDSVPNQLAKENTKFIFSHVKAGKRAADLEDALQWLLDAGLIHKLKLVETPQLPLESSASSTAFKAYFCDIGLLRRKAGLNVETLLDNSDQYKNFKGSLTENYVLNELLSLGIEPYYWKSTNQAELDFIFNYGNMIVPMEAKAEIHTKAKSYLSFCKRYNPAVGFKVSMKNVGLNMAAQTKTYSLPLYLMWKLPEYLKAEEPGSLEALFLQKTDLSKINL